MGKLFNRIFIIFTLLFILILSLGMVSAEDNITDLKEMQNDSSSCTDLTLDLDCVDQNQADSVVNENNNSDSNCDYIEEGSVNEQDSNQNINSKLLLGENRDSSMSDKNLNVSLRNYSGRTDSECLIYAKLIDSDGTKSKRINITIDGKTFNDSYTSPFLFGLTLPSNEGIYGCQIVVYDSITNETYGTIMYYSSAVYVFDANNDGYRDFCTVRSDGSGVIYWYVTIYDLHNQKEIFKHWERLRYSYFLLLKENDLYQGKFYNSTLTS